LDKRLSNPYCQSMNKSKKDSIKGDRALSNGAEDKLGFRDVASRIAKALINHSTDNGFVVGLEGKWGSGKSSLLYLVENELENLPSANRPTIINFRPWLIGNRDSLLAYLFTALNKGIAEFEQQQGNATKDTMLKAKAAGKALQTFANGLGHVGGVIEIAGDASGFVPIKWLGKGISALKNLGKDDAKKPQLDKLKGDLEKSLLELGHRFIITIDDADRLDPEEVVEILRLTRSVADLPNIIYLVCYDKDILAEGIQSSAKVKDGHAYLEKIVQLTVMVPTPEPFQLRSWFADELETFAIASDEAKDRLRTVIDYEGGRQLNTLFPVSDR
jgi:predicted KAP-like P-loop ATPase